MIVRAYSESASSGSLPETCVAVGVFAQAVQQLDDDSRLRVRLPGLRRNAALVYSGERVSLVDSFSHGWAGTPVAARAIHLILKGEACDTTAPRWLISARTPGWTQPRSWRFDLKFYDCATAPSPRRVRVFIAEKGIDIETVPVDLANGEQFSESYRAINPDCVVPALELDDGTSISEVVAICQYLEEQFPEPSLMGRTPEERARVLMWNAKAEQQGMAACADAFRNRAKGLKGHALPGPDSYEQIPELAERGRRRVANFLARLDRELADRDYVAGDFFSMADITALVICDFAGRLNIDSPDDAVHLRRWYDSVSSRPSASV